MRATALVCSAVLLPALLPAEATHLPPPPLPPSVLATASVAGNSSFAGRFQLPSGGSVSLSVAVATTQWPVHDGFGFFLQTGSGAPVLAGGVAVLEAEEKAYVQANVSGVEVKETIVRERHLAQTLVRVTLVVSGLWSGPWLMTGSGASPDGVSRVAYELRGPADAEAGNNTTGTRGFFFLDDHFEGSAHVQAGDDTLFTRAEAAVAVEERLAVQDRLFAAFVANAQHASLRIDSPLGTFSGASCFFVVDAPPGAWRFAVDRMVGATPAVLAPVGFPCSGEPALDAVTATTSPEGIFLIGADAALPP